jgi:uncharacterized membrane protein
VNWAARSAAADVNDSRLHQPAAWNHVRTIAPIVSAILFTAALCLA